MKSLPCNWYNTDRNITKERLKNSLLYSLFQAFKSKKNVTFLFFFKNSTPARLYIILNKSSSERTTIHRNDFIPNPKISLSPQSQTKSCRLAKNETQEYLKQMTVKWQMDLRSERVQPDIALPFSKLSSGLDRF